MAYLRNDSECDDLSFVEFKDDFEDLTRQALTLSSHTNDQQSRENTDETCNVKIIKVKGNKIDIVVSECSVAQFGSDTKAVQCYEKIRRFTVISLLFGKYRKKPTVTSFQLTTRNLNIILCTLPTLCTPVRVQHRLSFSTQIVR